jgi:L-arabinose isomerase
LFGIGLEAHWPQLPGIKERLDGCVRFVAKRLEQPDVEIINLGLIDSPERAMEAGHQFRREDVDVIFLHVTAYGPAHHCAVGVGHTMDRFEKLGQLLGIPTVRVC